LVIAPGIDHFAIAAVAVQDAFDSERATDIVVLSKRRRGHCGLTVAAAAAVVVPKCYSDTGSDADNAIGSVVSQSGMK
jgi:hypothetical protein